MKQFTEKSGYDFGSIQSLTRAIIAAPEQERDRVAKSFLMMTLHNAGVECKSTSELGFTCNDGANSVKIERLMVSIDGVVSLRGPILESFEDAFEILVAPVISKRETEAAN